MSDDFDDATSPVQLRRSDKRYSLLRWIPISEKHPPVGVTVFLKMRRGFDVGFVGVDDEEGLSWNWEGPSQSPPTHWMHIPYLPPFPS